MIAKPSYGEGETCPLQVATTILAGKWKLHILRLLLFEDCLRFGELRKRIEKISTKVLTENLRQLEEEGIVTRKVYPSVPPKVEYRVSGVGRELHPIFMNLGRWGRKTAAMRAADDRAAT